MGRDWYDTLRTADVAGSSNSGAGWEECMSRICEISGKRPVVANKITRRGKAKRKGGVGRKTTGITKHWQYPNLHKVRIEVAGHKLTFKVASGYMGKVYELVDRAKGMRTEGLSDAQLKSRLLKLLK